MRPLHLGGKGRRVGPGNERPAAERPEGHGRFAGRCDVARTAPSPWNGAVWGGDAQPLAVLLMAFVAA